MRTIAICIAATVLSCNCFPSEQEDARIRRIEGSPTYQKYLAEEKEKVYQEKATRRLRYGTAGRADFTTEENDRFATENPRFKDRDAQPSPQRRLEGVPGPQLLDYTESRNAGGALLYILVVARKGVDRICEHRSNMDRH